METRHDVKRAKSNIQDIKGCHQANWPLTPWCLYLVSRLRAANEKNPHEGEFTPGLTTEAPRG